jgi:CheY-like chemotaxis protein
MPEMDGLEATALIREREQRTGAHLPIVALTARAMKGDREHCLEAGMDAFVSKPVRSEELLAALEAVLDSPLCVQTEATTGGRARRVVDEAALVKLVDGRTELMFELVDLFFEDCPRHLAEMRSAIDAKDCAALQFAAHALKGSAGSLTAERTFDAALRLEMRARDGDLTRARHDLVALEQELEHLREALGALAERSDK